MNEMVVGVSRTQITSIAGGSIGADAVHSFYLA